MPIVAGGVEASLRRLAHYDFWSDKVRRSILLDAKPDLVVFGMGERPLVEIVKRLAAGESVRQLRDIRGVAYRLGAKEAEERGEGRGERGEEENGDAASGSSLTPLPSPLSPLLLPSYEEVSADKAAFAAMTRMIHLETNPYNARRLVQFHGREAVIVNPPAWPLAEEEMDRVYGLPFTRGPHPSYSPERIPAFEVVKDSIQIARGCFGGCTFCSITVHEGRVVQSRSRESILAEIGRMAESPDFSGIVSDLGGPTANMYHMNCCRPEMRDKCRRLSCLRPSICPMLATDHGPLIELLKAARRVPGVKQALVASGIRMDLALRSPAFIREVARHHTGGLLKVAPEHTDPEVLRRMNKPPVEDFEAFSEHFDREAAAAGKQEFLVPYFIAGHPGCDLPAMIDLALYLKRHAIRPDKVQDFIPGPMDVATCMYYTGLDPINGESVYVARGARERRLQRALLAILQAGELCRRARGFGGSRPVGPDRQWARVFDRFASAEDKRPLWCRPRLHGSRNAIRRLSATSENGQERTERPTKEPYQCWPELRSSIQQKRRRWRRRKIDSIAMYQISLLDFGDGRRLERFGDITLDRPCPAAEAFQRADPDLWLQADARFEGRENERANGPTVANCPSGGPSLGAALLRVETDRLSAISGLFPEQAENWQWIVEPYRSAASPRSGRGNA